MDKSLKSRLDPKILELPIGLACICASKRIKLADKVNPADENKFILDNRKLIIDYHKLTGDYRSFIKNMLKGKATLNEKQLEEYQRKDFIRVYGEFSEEAYLYSDLCGGFCCDDPEH